MRRLVSGVRSSWLASLTSRCCSCRDVPSASTIVVNERPRLAISLGPPTGTATARSWVAAICSAVARSRSTGRTVRRASSQPSSTAAPTPTDADAERASAAWSRARRRPRRGRARSGARSRRLRDGEHAVALARRSVRAQLRVAVAARSAISRVGLVDRQRDATLDADRGGAVGGDELRARPPAASRPRGALRRPGEVGRRRRRSSGRAVRLLGAAVGSCSRLCSYALTTSAARVASDSSTLRSSRSATARYAPTPTNPITSAVIRPRPRARRQRRLTDVHGVLAGAARSRRRARCARGAARRRPRSWRGGSRRRRRASASWSRSRSPRCGRR